MSARLRLLACLLVLLWPSLAGAQSVRADRVTLSAGPCTMSSGSGNPEGVVTGKVCDSFMDTASGTLYSKTSGTGTAGWQPVGLGGSGTANTLAMWTGAKTLGNSVITQPSGNLVMTPTGDIITAPAGQDVLPNLAYTVRLGAPTLQYLSIDVAELHAQTLVAQDVIATIGGMVDVAPTTQLVADLSSSATTIHVKHNEMASGDRALLKTSPGGVPQFEVLAITSGPSGSAGDYTYTVTRNLDGTGANAWSAGDAVLNTGTTGDGLIELYSTGGLFGGSGPSILGTQRTGTAYNAMSPRWLVGNLNGYYGYGTTTFGFAAGDASATNVTVDATNGFRIRTGTTNLLAADTAGNLSLAGDLTVGTAGVIRSAGATAYGTGTGFWMAGGATPVFRIGNPAGSRLTWDGTTLAVSGVDGSGLTNINGNAIQTGTINVGSLNATGFGDNVIKNGTFEGPSVAAAIDGWSSDGTGAAVTQSCCGLNGPGTLLLDPGNGFYAASAYTAFPVVQGQTYRVSFRIFAAAASSGYDAFMAESDTTSFVRRVKAFGTPASPDVAMDHYGTLGTCSGALALGWQTCSTVYTPTAGARWASFTVRQATGSLAGTTYGGSATTYTAVHLDDIEVQKQIGPGHVTTHSLTANEIAANTLTANEIAANAIGTSELQAASVTAAKISVTQLSAITADLGAATGGSYVVGTTNKIWLNDAGDGALAIGGSTKASAPFRVEFNGNFSVGAPSGNRLTWNGTTLAIYGDGGGVTNLNGGNLQTGTVTASKINVSSLAAITADLGTVNTGTLNSVNVNVSSGGTITAGSATMNSGGFHIGSDITIDGSGITMPVGSIGSGAKLTMGGGYLFANATGSLYWSHNLTVEDDVISQNVYIDDVLQVGDEISFVNMLSSTGTTVIWENACGCLKKQTSSLRYKDHVRDWSPADPLALLDARTIRYDYKGGGAKDVIGLSAEDMRDVSPFLVNLDAQGRPDSIRQDALNVYFLAALKALRDDLEQVKAGR